jgi:hypothetical protein
VAGAETAGDKGQHTFSATLQTAGTRSITATDTADPGITGTQSGIVVNPAATSALVVAGYPSPTRRREFHDFTVTAVDPYGNVTTGYRGTVTFATTDAGPGVVLPADYTFTPGDGGVHTFTDTGLGETTLVTPGEQSLTITDTADGTITGNASVTVGGAAPVSGQAPVSNSGQRTVPSNALTGSARPGPEVANVDRYFALVLPEGSGSLGSPKHARRGETGPWVLEWPGLPDLLDA